MPELDSCGQCGEPAVARIEVFGDATFEPDAGEVCRVPQSGHADPDAVLYVHRAPEEIPRESVGLLRADGGTGKRHLECPDCGRRTAHYQPGDVQWECLACGRRHEVPRADGGLPPFTASDEHGCPVDIVSDGGPRGDGPLADCHACGRTVNTWVNDRCPSTNCRTPLEVTRDGNR